MILRSFILARRLGRLPEVEDADHVLATVLTGWEDSPMQEDFHLRDGKPQSRAAVIGFITNWTKYCSHARNKPFLNASRRDKAAKTRFDFVDVGGTLRISVTGSSRSEQVVVVARVSGGKYVACLANEARAWGDTYAGWVRDTSKVAFTDQGEMKNL